MVLTKIVLPDGSFYDLPKSGYFASNIPGDFTTPCKTGLLQRLRLPTKGSVEWDYMLYKFPSTSTTRGIWQKTPGVSVRRILDAAGSRVGQWTYGTALSGGTNAHETLLTNSVTDPLGNQTRRFFSVCVGNCSDAVNGPYEYGLPVGRDVGGDGTGRFLSTQLLDASSVAVRTIYARFEHDTPGAATFEERGRLNQRLASQRLAFNDDVAGTYADDTIPFSTAWVTGATHRRHLLAATSVHAVGSTPDRHLRPGGLRPMAGQLALSSTATSSLGPGKREDQYRISCFAPSTGFLLRRHVPKIAGRPGAEGPVGC